MESPYLKQILDLICTYSRYDSHEVIAKRLDLAPRTLRGYWEADKYAGRIPDRNVARFAELLQEILPNEISPASARALLSGHPGTFHNAILPMAGRAWNSLIDEHLQTEPLTITVKPIAGLSFAEPDDEEVSPPATAKMHQRFFFTGLVPFAGEAVLFAEHGGEWRAISISGNERILPVTGTFTVPPRQEDKQRCFRERDKAGLYRYFLIAQRGRMATTLREHLHHANPYPQASLDLLGDWFGSLAPKDRRVLGATIRIE